MEGRAPCSSTPSLSFQPFKVQAELVAVAVAIDVGARALQRHLVRRD
jgi:hypothetical protein